MKDETNEPGMNDLRGEQIRAALAAIASANEGYLVPEDVVEAARRVTHPLHSEFEWDDDAASELYRRAQAGALIRRVKITVVRAPTKEKIVSLDVKREERPKPKIESEKVREYQHPSGDGYEEIKRIMSDEDKRDALLRQVIKELESYRRRYRSLVDLAAVWSAVDDVIDKHMPTQRQVVAGQASKQA